jgi:hypothetical protein
MPIPRRITVALLAVLTVAVAALAAFAAHAGTPTPSALDVTRLPLDDDHVSTGPKRGYLYACQQTPARPRGTPHSGPWIHGSSFDLPQKVVVEGAIHWNGRISFALRGSKLLIKGNSLPRESPTGTFPIAAEDPAYEYDRNPNAISAHEFTLSLPASPTLAATPSCVPMGVIGISVNGVPLFNSIDAAGLDAVAHETQDACGGHPQAGGIYHYHAFSSCVTGTTVESQEGLVGYALDGFPIFGPRDSNGKLLTDADLDACHGHVGWVTLRGKRVRIYHYNATLEYPYTLGCFSGTPVASPLGAGGRP